jgi:3-ketosteroid 9alpha-monooxygenase subunit A
MLNTGFAPTLHSGWYFGAMIDELTAAVTPLPIGDRRLMIVRDLAGRPRVYDAICPHRGADLGHGGVLTRAGVLCPFHGKSVTLGSRTGSRYSVAELPSLQAGGALFVSLQAEPPDDNGFSEHLLGLAGTHRFFPCPPVDVRVPQELVVENAFDLDHFIQVHRIPKVTATGWGRTSGGAAFCEARFLVRMPAWDGAGDTIIQNRFYARAFSPSVVVSELGAAGIGQSVITTAVPTAGGCRVRVINALRPEPDGSVPAQAVRALTDGARKALEQDAPVWNNLDQHMAPTFDARDEPVLLFREFCADFSDVAVVRVAC